MEYVHGSLEWPRLTWDAGEVGGLLARVRHQQGRLLGRMESMGFEVRSESNLAMLVRDVMKTSAIEGEKLDDEEVRSSIGRRLGLDVAGLKRPSRDVEGVVEMMMDATGRWNEPLTEERLFGWHRSLFPTGGRWLRVGAWRGDELGPMQVVSGQIGSECVRFEAPAAARIPGEMAKFLEWFNAQGDLDPVLCAGAAHFWFVTIHPFEDGNGRIARAIADLCLARADGTAQRFYSMSAQIEAESADYYRALGAAQRGDVNITGWMGWFLGCLGRALESADGQLAATLRKARVWSRLSSGTVNERQRLVMNRMLDGFQGFMTTSKYAVIAKCSTDTALRDIQTLVERGVLLANPGRGRSVSYRVAE